jgi:Na+-transporting NADH:ubiquinone oxidoreductase subunit B
MAEKRPKRILLKQSAMRRVVLALLPCIAGAVYFFGWRSLFLIVYSAVVGFIVEHIFTRRRNEPVSEAVFVTTTLFALIMPPSVPLHVVTVGVVFAVMFTKEIFGGFGRNIFNPALAGRCFVYICFPVALTSTWAPAAQGSWGAFRQWMTAPSADATTSATPMAYLKAGRLTIGSGESTLSQVPFDVPEGQTARVESATLFSALTFGRLSGTMGVTSALLIVIGGLYLYWTKTASRTIILWLIGTYAVLVQILHWSGVHPVPPAWVAVLGGGFLFGAFFMATDPVSAPKTEVGRILYAIIIAICTVVIRNFSVFNGGLMFSILIGNMFGPILDYMVRARGRSVQSHPAPHSSDERKVTSNAKGAT